MNQITISGRMVRNPELRHTTNGTPVTAFTVAVDRPGTYGENKKTDFLDCVAWRERGENIAKYFAKGDRILLTGQLNLRDWTDADNHKRRNAEIVVKDWEFIETRRVPGNGTPDKQGSESAGPAHDAPVGSGAYTSPVTGSAFEPMYDDDGDLPF